MTFSEQAFHVYQQFYEQRSVLSGAPALTIDPTAVGMNDFPAEKGMDELAALVSYLLGRQDIRALSFEEGLKIVESAYANQPFWFNLLLEYFNVVLLQEDEACFKKAQQVQEQALNMIDEIGRYEAKRKAVIQFLADKIHAEKFSVDGTKLVTNFLKMLGKDAEKAKEVLYTNPAYFAPIMARDVNGNTRLTPTQAMEENKQLGVFLKRAFK